jgi:abhydrolase domain-containing protein 6
MTTLFLGVPLLLLGSYYLCPLPWARLLMFVERTRSGLKAKRLTVDGRTFHYLEGGRGPAVVMLHGFGADSEQWVPMARSLTGRFRLLVPDLPGFGRTSASVSERFELPLQAERLRSLLQALGVHRYHLIANSMGGNIAGLLAHDHPDEVASLTLLEPQGIESRIPSAMDLQIRQGQTPLIPARKEEFDRLVDLAFVERPFIPRAVYSYLRRQSLASETLHAASGGTSGAPSTRTSCRRTCRASALPRSSSGETATGFSLTRRSRSSNAACATCGWCG